MSAEVVSVVEVWAEVLPGGNLRVKVELSDGKVLQLLRSDVDLAQMMKTLVDCFPDDREMLSCSLLPGLLAIRAADQSSNPEVKMGELNSLLRIIINLPTKLSQSEAVLGFFKASAVDDATTQEERLTIKQEEVLQEDEKKELEVLMEEGEEEEEEEVKGEEQLSTHKGLAPPSDVLMANGFCLANTESILFDVAPPTPVPTQPTDSTSRRASVAPAVCLQLCHPSISPHLLRGFTGMMGKLAKRRSSRRSAAPPP